MRDHKGYLEINKQRKRGCVKMALDDLWKQEKEKDKSRGKKTGESKENSGAKYDSSIQFWSSLSRTKATASAINDGDKCGKSLPLLEDSDHNVRDVQKKKNLSNSENTNKIFKCFNEENKKFCADTTSLALSKLSIHDIDHHITDSPTEIHKMKFEHIMAENKKYLLNKYKTKKQNHESAIKELNTCNNTSEIIPANNKASRIKIPVQIDRKKLKITAKEELSKKEDNSQKFYYKETMEADSTVSNDKKDDTHTCSNKNRKELKDISQHKLYQSVTKDKFEDNLNVPIIPNKISLNPKKRKRIQEKLRHCFGDCFTVSEGEEEESILDSRVYKRQKKNFNEALNDSTNFKSHTVSDITLSQVKTQDTSTSLVTYEDVTNDTVSTKPSNCNIEQIEAVSSIINEDSKSKKSIDTESNVLPDSNINNNNCNDTNMEELNNDTVQIRTSSEKSSSNNNYDETTCHVSQNNYVKESQLNSESDDLGTASTILNLTSDSASPIEVLETSKNTEIHSKALPDNASTDILKQRKSAIVMNTNFIKTSKCTLRETNMSQEHIGNSIPETYEQCMEKVSEDLSQILQMDINQNHTIQCDGNTISIQENLEQDTSQYAMVEDISISNVTNDENKISSKDSASKTEEIFIEKCSPMVTNNNLEEQINISNVQNEDGIAIPILSDEKAKLNTNNNMINNISRIVSNTLSQNTSLASNAESPNNIESTNNTENVNNTVIVSNTVIVNNTKNFHNIDNVNNIDNANYIESDNTENFKQPETSQSNKIRVLSSAELGSRWCPTPSSNPALNSKLPFYTATKVINNNEPCKVTTRNTESDLNSISSQMQLTLSYIYNIMKRIRTIEKKYSSNNCQNTGNQKAISDDNQFKSNFTVLIQELVNLGKELKIFNIDEVLEYALSVINKHYMISEYAPISIYELSYYIKLMNSKVLKSTTTPSGDVSVSNEQGKNGYSTSIVTTKPVANAPNNPNAAPITLSFIPNLYVSATSQSHTTHGNLPKKNIYISKVPNQNYERNVSNLQTMQTSNTSFSYIPSMQSKHKNVRVLQENRVSSLNIPHYQRLIPQQTIPVVAITNVPNSNIMQLKNNTHVAQKTNMHQQSQEGLIRNQSEFLVGQYSIPQRSQIYVTRNPQNTQVSCSTTMPMHLQDLLTKKNIMPYEIIFKIWDQLNYCLEKTLTDCRDHTNNCPLQLFSENWKERMFNFMYQRMQSKHDEPLEILSQEALCRYRYILKQDKLRHEQLLLKNKESQKQAVLINILNKNTIRNNLVSSINSKSQNVVVQSEVTKHKPRKYKKNVNSEKQQQSQGQLNVQLLNNIAISVHNPESNVSEKNNSLLVGSNFINSENVNVIAFASSENKTEKQKNMLKTDGVSSLENGDIEIVETVYRKGESLLSKQAATEEIIYVHVENLLPKQTARKENVHMQQESLLLKQTASKENVHMQQESLLLKQTASKENVHMQQESLLLKQTASKENVHVQEESILPKQTAAKEIVRVQEKSLLPKQTAIEEIGLEKQSSLPQETITEETVPGKENSSVIGQIIKNKANYLQCHSIQSLTLSDPHIVDVRSISPTSFNKMEGIYALNESQLSSTESIENDEIKVKIEIPDDVKTCLHCSKISTFICEVCLDAHYCSPECADTYWWLEHHKYCKPSSLRLSENRDNDVSMTEDRDSNDSRMSVP